mmetsp:Transcript_23025/g.61438  ORF Transcript_23025/g.61438 Transcript_23025/m.61438 type:complete len:317 (-) Transcript_23025:157-1107(-)
MTPLLALLGLCMHGEAIVFSSSLSSPQSHEQLPLCDVGYLSNTTEYGNGVWTHKGISGAEKSRVESAFRTSPNSGYNCGPHPRLLESMSWVWTPKTCRLHNFDSQHFNELLGGRSLVFIGDSISMCMADSLRFLGVESKETRFDLFAGFLDTQRDGSKLGPSDDDPRYVEKLSKLLRAPWLEMLERSGVKSTDILVLNKGAHGGGESFAAYQALAHRVAKVHSGQVLWRTTIHGHKDCQNFNGPIQNLSDDELKEFASSYNWMTFKQRNSWAIKALHEEMDGRFGIVDTSMFENRPDGHISQVFANDPAATRYQKK